MSQAESTVREAKEIASHDRRHFLMLTLDERRHELSVQVTRLIRHYRDRATTVERSQWQAGDIVES